MEYTGDAFHTFLDLDIRDATIAIFLADSDFFFGSVTCQYRF